MLVGRRPLVAHTQLLFIRKRTDRGGGFLHYMASFISFSIFSLILRQSSQRT
jgi:hypothetical protein